MVQQPDDRVGWHHGWQETSLERMAMAAATELLAEENKRLREKRQVAPMDPETFRRKLMEQLRAERGKA